MSGEEKLITLLRKTGKRPRGKDLGVLKEEDEEYLRRRQQQNEKEIEINDAKYMIEFTRFSKGETVTHPMYEDYELEQEMLLSSKLYYNEELAGFIDIYIGEVEAEEVQEVFLHDKFQGKGLCTDFLANVLHEFDVLMEKMGKEKTNKLKIFIKSYNPVAAYKCYTRAVAKVGFDPKSILGKKAHRTHIQIALDDITIVAELDDDKKMLRILHEGAYQFYSDAEKKEMYDKIVAQQLASAQGKGREEYRVDPNLTKFTASDIRKVFRKREDYVPDLFVRRVDGEIEAQRWQEILEFARSTKMFEMSKPDEKRQRKQVVRPGFVELD